MSPAQLSAQVVALAPGDEPRLRTLRLRSLQADPDAFYRTYGEQVCEPAEYWRRWLASAGNVVVVAVSDGQDVGLGGLVPDRKEPGALAVVAFWVDSAARGQGVARALMTELLSRARSHGVPAVSLEVADDNVAANRLYDEFGFEPTGETSTFGPPREHVAEHRRRLVI